MTTPSPVRLGLVGCGNISAVYLRNLRRCLAVQVVACADRVAERAARRAAEFEIPRACSVERLLDDPEVELVLNLTTPQAHAEIALAALAAGKSVYNEKPLAVELEDGRQIVATARAAGLRVGCAPDTFLGGAWQAARRLIDSGAIGEPLAATACMLCHGHEHWHPDPDFLYQPGAGPLFDMGPYYLTALISLLGPLRRVAGTARAGLPERVIDAGPRRGQRIRVETPTHVIALLEFDSGPVAGLTTSFDVWHSELPCLEVYGTEATLSLPDPNGFGGPVRIARGREAEWQEVPPASRLVENERGLGVVDLAWACRTGRRQRASGELALHVLETLHGVLRSAEEGRHVLLTTRCDRPPPADSGFCWERPG